MLLGQAGRNPDRSGALKTCILDRTAFPTTALMQQRIRDLVSEGLRVEVRNGSTPVFAVYRCALVRSPVAPVSGHMRA